jgi:hypothetical protein
MAYANTRDACPDCGKPMAYDIRRDEFICPTHGRLLEKERGVFQKAPPIPRYLAVLAILDTQDKTSLGDHGLHVSTPLDEQASDEEINAAFAQMASSGVSTLTQRHARRKK